MLPTDPSPNKSFRTQSLCRLAAISAVGLFILVGAVLSFRHQEGVVFPDEQDYYRLAENLVEYHMLTWDGVAPTASRPPGFVVWLALWKSIGVGWGGMVWVNSLIVAFGLWLLAGVWFPAEQRWSGRAVVFGLLFCYPVTFYVFSTLYPQAFCLALMAVSLALLMGRAGWIWTSVLAGVLMGWCALSAPMYATWGGIVALVPLFRRRLGGIPSAILFSAVFSLVIASWGIRNVVVMGKFVPFSTNSGYNLLIGNCEETRPNAGLNIDTSRYTAEASSRGLGETEADTFYAALAKKWITENPGRAVAMYFQKLVNSFNFRNDLVTTSAASPARDLVMFVTYYALLAALLFRLALAWPAGRAGWRDWLLVGGYIACAMLTSVATTRIRYRIPCDVLLFFVIAPLILGFAETVWARIRRGRRGES